MKQATGRINHPSVTDNVSIQLALDGHSFSIVGGQRIQPVPAVKVEILTARTLLVPEELFAPEQAAALLAADGKAPLTGEETICTAPQDGIVAVMAVPSQALQQLRERLDEGTALTYTTPLLLDPHPTKPTVLLQWIAGYLYIKIYHERLRLAEVLSAPADADIRYAIERFDTAFPLNRYTLQIAGGEARRLGKLAGKFFKHVRCE